MMQLNWQIACHKTETEIPENWFNANVPGAAQLDCVSEELRESWQFANNADQFKQLEDFWYTYKTQFPKPDIIKGEQVFFISNGIDYHFKIFLNNQEVFEQEGMFKHVKVNLTPFLKKDNELLVRIYPVPKAQHHTADRTQAAQSVKPTVSYGWDWHPRLIPSGIWDETYIQIEKPGIEKLSFDYKLSGTLHEAFCKLNLKLHESVKSIQIEANLNGLAVFKKEFAPSERIEFVLNDLKLWYPYEFGDQQIYNLVFSAFDEKENLLNSKQLRTGFRQVRLVLNSGTEKEPDIFPKSKRKAPITLEVNGIRIFAKGTNWVNPDVFPGNITNERYKKLIDQAKKAHFNLLRVWGGGIVNKSFFYEYCDQLGIIVWQEFPLACNNYPDDEAYLSVLEEEARAIVQQNKHHPCIVIWCGGNELFNSWSGMNEQSLAIRLLNSICLQEVPTIPFLPTSPMDGMAHGHYLFWDEAKQQDVFQCMAKAANTAYTEFGMPSAANVEVLKKIIPEEELFPPQKSSEAWVKHHAFESWEEDTWLCLKTIVKYFGVPLDIEEMVNNSQRLQAIGYKAIFETARQQWPACSMSLNWCYNEPWMTAANNSIVDYIGNEKPAFYAIQEACRPILISAAFPKFEWAIGEVLSFGLFVLSNSAIKTENDSVEVFINGQHILSWRIEESEANEKQIGPNINWIIPQNSDKEISIELKAQKHPQWNSNYVIFIKENIIQKNENSLNH